MFGPFSRHGGPGFGCGHEPIGAPIFGRGPGRPRWDEGNGGFGPPPFGPFMRGARGFGRRAERFLERGDLKYVILDLLQEQPRHGYDIIRALEERFGGFYSPSPGVIYPTLQLLEDQGAVTGAEQDGKKVYTITEAGRHLLAERPDHLAGIRDRMRAWGPSQHPQFGELM
ncbi:MAG: PadR family transcriptional regulator, partial [Dehalococcoidia bacterium]